MIVARTVRALTAGALLLPAGLGDLLHLPTWAERWLWNERERTETARAELEAQRPERALAAADTALRLGPDDPRVQFDVGTVRLLAGQPRAALAPLESAAQDAPAALAADAHYNLGTGRLAAGDAAGAVEALEQALRLDPHHAAAKHNLELALAARERERMRAKQPQNGPRGDRAGDRNPGDRGPGTDPDSDPRRAPGQARDHRPETGNSGGEGERPPAPPAAPNAPGARERPLPRFRDQADMSAAEAAQILRAVENLERQQRRAAAERRAREAARSEPDWKDW